MGEILVRLTYKRDGLRLAAEWGGVVQLKGVSGTLCLSQEYYVLSVPY